MYKHPVRHWATALQHGRGMYPAFLKNSNKGKFLTSYILNGQTNRHWQNKPQFVRSQGKAREGKHRHLLFSPLDLLRKIKWSTRSYMDVTVDSPLYFYVGQICPPPFPDLPYSETHPIWLRSVYTCIKYPTRELKGTEITDETEMWSAGAGQKGSCRKCFSYISATQELFFYHRFVCSTPGFTIVGRTWKR